jgi:hypothetical protein
MVQSPIIGNCPRNLSRTPAAYLSWRIVPRYRTAQYQWIHIVTGGENNLSGFSRRHIWQLDILHGLGTRREGFVSVCGNS